LGGVLGGVGRVSSGSIVNSSDQNSSAIIQSLFRHIVSSEKAFGATRSLITSSHALAAYISAALEGGGEVIDTGSSVALVTAQLARTLEGTSSVGGILSSLRRVDPRELLPGGLPEQVTQPQMLAHLVAQCTETVEKVLSDLSSHSAAKVGEECTMQ